MLTVDFSDSDSDLFILCMKEIDSGIQFHDRNKNSVMNNGNNDRNNNRSNNEIIIKKHNSWVEYHIKEMRIPEQTNKQTKRKKIAINDKRKLGCGGWRGKNIKFKKNRK